MCMDNLNLFIPENTSHFPECQIVIAPGLRQ